MHWYHIVMLVCMAILSVFILVAGVKLWKWIANDNHLPVIQGLPVPGARVTAPRGHRRNTSFGANPARPAPVHVLHRRAPLDNDSIQESIELQVMPARPAGAHDNEREVTPSSSAFPTPRVGT